jgi:hypothetical protein
MADDANQEGEWITGFNGDIFVDKQGNIIKSAEDEPQPSEPPDFGAVMDAFDKAKWANPPEVDTPIGSIPDWDPVPTGIVPDQPDDTGVGAGSIPADAETST